MNDPCSGKRSEARQSLPGPCLVRLSLCGRSPRYCQISRILPVADQLGRPDQLAGPRACPAADPTVVTSPAQAEALLAAIARIRSC